jgi:hypothetical protein
MASRRSPSTPISSQKSSVLNISARTARVLEVEVRLVRVEAVPVVGVGDRSHVQLDVSKSLKMMRASLYLSGVSLHTYQSR